MHIILGVLIPLWPILSSSPGLRCCALALFASRCRQLGVLLLHCHWRSIPKRTTCVRTQTRFIISRGKRKSPRAELSFVGCFVLRSAPSNFCRAKLATFLGTPINRRFILGSGDRLFEAPHFFSSGGQKGKELDVVGCVWDMSKEAACCFRKIDHGIRPGQSSTLVAQRMFWMIFFLGKMWDYSWLDFSCSPVHRIYSGRAGSGGLVASSKQDTSSMKTTIHVLHLG